jgi:hypothetical protein
MGMQEYLSVYKKIDLPDKLYHYTSMENFRKIIESGLFYLFGTHTMNDYKENIVVIEIFNEIVNDIATNNSGWNIKELAEYMTRRYNYYFSYVFCLTELYDSLSQWRAYGDDGNGICIIINTSGLRLDYKLPSQSMPLIGDHNNKNNSFVLHNIIYSKQEQRKIINQLINQHEMYKNTKELYNSHWSIDEVGDHIMNYGPIFKIEEFKEEKEWRIIYTPTFLPVNIPPITSNDYNINMGFINTRDKIKSYFTFSYDFINCFDGVLVGPKNKSLFYEIRAFLQANHLNNKKIEKSKISYG